MFLVKDFIDLAVDKNDGVRVWSANTCKVEFQGTYNELAKSEYAEEVVDSINVELSDNFSRVICLNVN